MTAALEGGEWSAARPGRTLPPGKTRYPFHRRLAGPQGRSGRSKNLVPTGIRSWTVQPVVSHYTDWATRPTCFLLLRLIFLFLWKHEGRPRQTVALEPHERSTSILLPWEYFLLNYRLTKFQSPLPYEYPAVLKIGPYIFLTMTLRCVTIWFWRSLTEVLETV
jgi:hypothetical protein